MGGDEHVLNRRVSFDSSRAASCWLLGDGCNVVCMRATVIRERDKCKIYTGIGIGILTRSTTIAVSHDIVYGLRTGEPSEVKAIPDASTVGMPHPFSSDLSSWMFEDAVCTQQSFAPAIRE